ncbi:hypothetical protein ACLESD_54115, partial [Pyxidicoccus sp. 3LFB2]
PGGGGDERHGHRLGCAPGLTVMFAYQGFEIVPVSCRAGRARPSRRRAPGHGGRRCSPPCSSTWAVVWACVAALPELATSPAPL